MASVPAVNAAYVSRAGPGRDGVRLALDWLRQQPPVGNILVLAPQRSSLSDVSTLLKASDLDVATMKGFHGTPHAKALALWLPADGLGRLLDSRSVATLAVVPWRIDEITWWLKAFQPTDLLNAGQPHSVDVGEPVVAVALELLTSRVNLSAALSHPSDEAAAADALRLLLRHGHRIDRDELIAWCVAHGWRYSDAVELGDMLSKLQQGRRVKAGDGAAWKSDVYDLWIAMAEERA